MISTKGDLRIFFEIIQTLLEMSRGRYVQKMVGFSFFLYIGCFFILHSVTGTTLSDSACYGTNPDCDYYTLSCNTTEHVIRLQDLYVGYKPDDVCAPVTHCNNSDLCCNKAPEDDLYLFNLRNTFGAYNNCSGKQECKDVQAPWQQIGSNTSSFVYMEYSCIEETNILNFCGSALDDSAVTLTSGSIDIMFDSRKGNNTGKTQTDCRCGVESTDGSLVNVSMTFIDLRLHSYETKGNESQQYECSSANFSSDVYIGSCTKSTVHHEDNFRYDNSDPFFWEVMDESNIFLYNLFNRSGLDSPAMVWFSVSAVEDGRNLTVTCNEVFPSTTTETPSTTETTSVLSSMTTTASSTTTEPSTSSSTQPTTSTTIEPSTPTSSAPSTTTGLPTSTTLHASTVVSPESLKDDDDDDTSLYLAIFIPVGFFLVTICVLVLVWRCCKKEKRRLKYLHDMDRFGQHRNSLILDKFIYDITNMDIDADSPAVLDGEVAANGKIHANPVFVEDSPRPPVQSISAYVSPPEYSSNSLSMMMQNSQFAHDQRGSYKIRMSNDGDLKKEQNRESELSGIIHVKLTKPDWNLQEDIPNVSQIETHPMQNRESPVQNQASSKQNGSVLNSKKDVSRPKDIIPSDTKAKSTQHVIEQMDDGGVVIHIGSLSDKTNNINSSGATNIDSPAIIVPESTEARTSATAHILPAHKAGDENTVLFVSDPNKRSV